MKVIVKYLFIAGGFFIIGMAAYHIFVPPRIAEEIPIATHEAIATPDSSYIIELKLTQKELDDYRRNIALLRMRFRSREGYLLNELVMLRNNTEDADKTVYSVSATTPGGNDEVGGTALVMSEKSFEFPYIKSNVISYGILPPIKMENKITVDYNSHFKDKILPEIDKKNKKKLWETRLTWFVIGVAGGIIIMDI